MTHSPYVTNQEVSAEEAQGEKHNRDAAAPLLTAAACAAEHAASPPPPHPPVVTKTNNVASTQRGTLPLLCRYRPARSREGTHGVQSDGEGRFEEAVIEERRKAAEAMLLFSTTIPALYNSPQLKDFFRGGEVTRPLDPTPLSTAGALPPPLIPLPKRRASDCEPAEEEEGREAPTLPQDLGTNLGLEVGEPEVAAEAYSEMGGSPREEEREELSDTELDDRVPSPNPSPARDHKSLDSQEEFDSLFDSAAEDQVPSPKEEDPPPLSDNDLAVFDPCYKQDRSSSTSDHSELFWLPPTSLNDGDVDYLNQAATELTAAMEREKEGEFSSAIHGYRTAVDILITGVQGDPDPVRRESVMRRTAQYLKHAEVLVDRHSSPTHTCTSAHTHAQGP
uniref:Sorting nexin 15 n=1 Tax=Scophthalmus maximus TaxID=52904 RepID=A0A8D3C1Q1_SCOMX